jgi:hypothetical protein
MHTVRWLLFWVAALLAAPAAGQKWVTYTPPERDFRVLFPSEPVRVPVNDGSVAYRALHEIGDHTVEYAVYRLPPSFQRGSDEAQDIQRLLLARLDGEGSVRWMREEDSAADYQRYVFQYRNSSSIDRIAGAPGRYYHLEVRTLGSRSLIAAQTARDFFASFSASGISIPGLVSGLGQRVETWCQGRTDPFTRAFCEYSACLQAGSEQDPRCTALFKR